MIILSDKCKKCNYMCNAMYFQQYFGNWTSGNSDIDKFIQDIQLSVHGTVKDVLEWIPYNRFYNITYIAKGGFGKVYRANWIDGYIYKWNDYNQYWERRNKHMFVALKSLDNSKDVTLKFIDEV
jgi:hypothetical protein